MREFLAVNNSAQIEVEYNGDYAVLHFVDATFSLSCQINDLDDLVALENMLMSAIARWERRNYNMQQAKRP